MTRDPADAVSAPPDVTFAAVSGLGGTVDRLREAVVRPFGDERYAGVGASGVLLHGPPGTGKTHLARALLGELDVPYVDVRPSAVELGDRDEAAAYVGAVGDLALERAPCAVFVDDLTLLGPDRDGDGGRWVPDQVVTALCRVLDAFDEQPGVVFVATATRLEAVDEAVRRPGRIDCQVGLEQPGRERRLAVLADELSGLPGGDEVVVEQFAEDTDGYSVAALVDAVERAGRAAADDGGPVAGRHVQAGLEAVADERDDVRYGESPDEGLGELFGSADDDGDDEEADAEGDEDDDPAPEGAFGDDRGTVWEDGSPTPDVTFDDVGGLADAKRTLRELVEWPREHPETFAELDLAASPGILLHGPPGTGKTALARALANETDSTFVGLSGPELLDKYFGESERFVRELFDFARERAPTVVFVDEFDSVAVRRGGYAGSTHYDTIVNQLLSELDGLEPMAEVVVVAATNRIELLDPAIRRPGRFGHEVEVGRPDEDARAEIFEIHTRDRPLADDVTPGWFAARTDDRYSGADVEAVCDRAARIAMRAAVESDDDGGGDPVVTREHVAAALEAITPAAERERLDGTGGGPTPGFQ